MENNTEKNTRTCKMMQQSNKYMKFPVKQAVVTPWEHLCVDIIGLYRIKGNNNISYKFMCITMVDPATCMLEVDKFLM